MLCARCACLRHAAHRRVGRFDVATVVVSHCVRLAPVLASGVRSVHTGYRLLVAEGQRVVTSYECARPREPDVNVTGLNLRNEQAHGFLDDPGAIPAAIADPRCPLLGDPTHECQVGQLASPDSASPPKNGHDTSEATPGRGGNARRIRADGRGPVRRSSGAVHRGCETI
jgi:hypothetical protein